MRMALYLICFILVFIAINVSEMAGEPVPSGAKIALGLFVAIAGTCLLADWEGSRKKPK